MTKFESTLSALYAMPLTDSGIVALTAFYVAFADHVQEYSDYCGLATNKLKAIVKKLDDAYSDDFDACSDDFVNQQNQICAQGDAQNELIEWIYDCPLYYDFFEDSPEKTTDELKCMAIFLRAVIIPEYEDDEETEALCDTLSDIASEWKNLY